MLEYNYLNFLITLCKFEHGLTLRFLDKNLYSVYQVILDELYVTKCSIGNLDNLYNILCTLLNSLESNVKPCCDQINLLIIGDKIKLKVNFNNNFVSFNFEIVCDQIQTNVIDEKDLYIKKLEEKINDLQNNLVITVCYNHNTNTEVVYVPLFLDTISIEKYPDNNKHIFIENNKLCINSRHTDYIDFSFLKLLSCRKLIIDNPSYVGNNILIYMKQCKYKQIVEK